MGAGAPLKKGLEYIPWSAADYATMEDLVMEFNNEQASRAFMCIRTVLMVEEGYFMLWNEEKEIRKLCFKKHLPQDLVEQVVSRLISVNYFDEAMYSAFGILTSVDIQRHFASVVRRRKGIERQDFIEEYFYPEIAEKIKEYKQLSIDKEAGKDTVKKPEIKEVPSWKDSISEKTEKYNEITEKINVDINSNDVVKLEENGQQEPEEIQTTIDIEKKRKEKNRKEKDSNNTINLNSTNLSFSDEVPDSQSAVEVSVSGPRGPAKKSPHPARAGIIAAWEKRFKLPFVQDKDTNTALAHLIRKIEGIMKIENIPPEKMNSGIIEYFKWLVAPENWAKLTVFYQQQVSFVALDKQFDKIVVQLRTENQSKHATTSTTKAETEEDYN